MKKLLLPALILALALSACQGSTAESAAPTAAPESDTSEPADLPEDEDSDSIDSDMSVDVGSGAGDEMEITPDEVSAPNAALRETLEKIYSAYSLAPMSVETSIVDLTDTTWYPYYTGLDADEISKVNAAIVSEPMTGSQAYSLVLAQVKNAEDAQEIADAMLAGIAMDKWVCVVADRARVVTFSDTVLYIMADSTLVDVDEMISAAADALDATFDYDVSSALTAD